MTRTLSDASTDSDTNNESDQDWASETLGTSATIASGSDRFTVNDLYILSYASPEVVPRVTAHGVFPQRHGHGKRRRLIVPAHASDLRRYPRNRRFNRLGQSQDPSAPRTRRCFLNRFRNGNACRQCNRPAQTASYSKQRPVLYKSWRSRQHAWSGGTIIGERAA